MKLPSFPVFSGKNTTDTDFNPFPDLPPKQPPKKIKTEHLIFSISLLIFLSSLGLYLSFKYNQSNLDISSNPNQQAQAAPTPTPKPLPTGKQVYNYSHGSKVVGPKPTQAIIEPIDPEDNQKQTLTITIPHDKEIIETKATLITDNKSTDIELEKDKESEDIYLASWKMTDTYDYHYQITFEFLDEFETFIGALTFR